MENQKKIKLTKEEWEKAKQYMNNICKIAEAKAICTRIEVINELIKRGKNPTSGIENKLSESVSQPILESARAKIHMFIDFLKQTQDVEFAIMLTECAESIIKDLRKGV